MARRLLPQHRWSGFWNCLHDECRDWPIGKSEDDRTIFALEIEGMVHEVLPSVDFAQLATLYIGAASDRARLRLDGERRVRSALNVV